MTEYLYRENNELMQANGKQDCETTAFYWENDITYGY